MTLSDVQIILSRISYKPGWKITATIDNVAGDLAIDYQMEVPFCSAGEFNLNIGDSITIEHRQIFHGLKYGTEKEVLHAVKCGIQYLEKHEYDEWLRLDGKLLDNPHNNKPVMYKEWYG